jgi:5'-nucleotidase
MRILLTNDDGIDSPGLRALAGALAEVGDVVVVAPATNQSAVARGITIRDDLEVERMEVDGAAEAYALTGTPVDCVRFAEVGIDGGRPDVVVSGANLGVNLGDDVTYSGTVAAAMEGVLLGLPALAVSQQPATGEIHHIAGGDYAFDDAQVLVPAIATALGRGDVGSDVIVNLNVPRPRMRGVRVARLGRRIWGDQIELVEDRGARRRFRLYTEDSDYHRERGTDFEAIAEGYASLTALHVDPHHPRGDELLLALRVDGLVGDAGSGAV